jgi:hypothetical protein
MWIRSAFWTGKPRSGQEAAFASAINEELVPALKRLPAVKDAAALWPERLEDSPPLIACQILVYFDDQAGVDTMLASPERLALRDRVRSVAQMFDGAISHIDYEVMR